MTLNPADYPVVYVDTMNGVTYRSDLPGSYTSSIIAAAMYESNLMGRSYHDLGARDVVILRADGIKSNGYNTPGLTGEYPEFSGNWVATKHIDYLYINTLAGQAARDAGTVAITISHEGGHNFKSVDEEVGNRYSAYATAFPILDRLSKLDRYNVSQAIEHVILGEQSDEQVGKWTSDGTFKKFGPYNGAIRFEEDLLDLINYLNVHDGSSAGYVSGVDDQYGTINLYTRIPKGSFEPRPEGASGFLGDLQKAVTELGEEFGQVFGSLASALRALNSPEANAFWDNPEAHLGSAAHDRFVSGTMRVAGLGAPPEGKTLVPNGGGFRFVDAGESQDSNSGGSGERSGNFRTDVGNFFSNLGRDLGLNPVLLDLDGNGVQIGDLSRSTRFMAGKDGLQHRTAWAGAGDGVLFYDVGGDGKISDAREYVFTEWAPGATDDMAALRLAFDSNGDGRLTSADAKFGDFKVLVTNADGTTSAKTLAQLGITEINLLPDTTKIVLPDGSEITGQSTFVMNGTSRTAANVTLMAEAQGYRTVQSSTLDSSGARVIRTTGYAANGDKAFVMVQTTSANGLTVTNTYDSDGDGVVDQIQTAVTAINEVIVRENIAREVSLPEQFRKRIRPQLNREQMNGTRQNPRRIPLIFVILACVLSSGSAELRADSLQSTANSRITGSCGEIDFSIESSSEGWVVLSRFDQAEDRRLLPSNEDEGHVVFTFLACEAGKRGHYLLVQYDDAAGECPKCSVVDIYDQKGELITGVWEKIFIEEDLMDIFSFSVGGR